MTWKDEIRKDSMTERHRKEREELLQRHSDETGIENLWFNIEILRNPKYAKQKKEREALRIRQKEEAEQKKD